MVIIIKNFYEKDLKTQQLFVNILFNISGESKTNNLKKIPKCLILKIITFFKINYVSRRCFYVNKDSMYCLKTNNLNNFNKKTINIILSILFMQKTNYIAIRHITSYVFLNPECYLFKNNNIRLRSIRIPISTISMYLSKDFLTKIRKIHLCSIRNQPRKIIGKLNRLGKLLIPSCELGCNNIILNLNDIELIKSSIEDMKNIDSCVVSKHVHISLNTSNNNNLRLLLIIKKIEKIIYGQFLKKKALYPTFFSWTDIKIESIFNKDEVSLDIYLSKTSTEIIYIGGGKNNNINFNKELEVDIIFNITKIRWIELKDTSKPTVIRYNLYIKKLYIHSNQESD